MPRTLLQESVPYGQSLKWDIHHRYYQQRGAAAWLKGEVPYYTTSNTAVAMQKAKLIAAAVARMEQEGSMRRDEPVYVLELASGQGLFAFNLIRMLRQLDAQSGTTIASRLRYLFTDFSAQTVRDAATVPKLRELAQEGVLIFGVMDALNPQDAVDLEGNPLPLSQLTAVISNYLQCCLPLTFVRRNMAGWHEKHIRLWLDVPEGENVEAFQKRSVEEPVGFDVMTRLTEDEEYLPMADGAIHDPLHLKVMDIVGKDIMQITMPYPHGSLQNIERTLPMLRKGGIMLHTDKGYADVTYWRGTTGKEPSLHGNGFAHSVNFPLLREVAKARGVAAVQTDDPKLIVQTLLIENRPASTLEEVFLSLYIGGNANADRADFDTASAALEKQGDLVVARRFLERALVCAPDDGNLLYRLASILDTQKKYAQSLELFIKCEAADIFGEYDCAFYQGKALHYLCRYGEAVEAYERSTARKPQDYTYYNIGLCSEELKEIEKAKENYKAALSVNPKFEKARERLNALAASPPSA